MKERFICVSRPFPALPLSFLFQEGAVMGHWSGLMAVSFRVFLSSLYYIPHQFESREEEKLKMKQIYSHNCSLFTRFIQTNGRNEYTNTSLSPSIKKLLSRLLPLLSSLFRDSWRQAKVYSWQQALVIKSFHWLISPYSSRTQARQTRTDSPNDQRHRLSGGSNAPCTCGTATHRHTHTHIVVPMGHFLTVSLTRTHVHTQLSYCIPVGDSPVFLLSWVKVMLAHSGIHFNTVASTNTLSLNT